MFLKLNCSRLVTTQNQLGVKVPLLAQELCPDCTWGYLRIWWKTRGRKERAKRMKRERWGGRREKDRQGSVAMCQSYKILVWQLSDRSRGGKGMSKAMIILFSHFRILWGDCRHHRAINYQCTGPSPAASSVCVNTYSIVAIGFFWIASPVEISSCFTQQIKENTFICFLFNTTRYSLRTDCNWPLQSFSFFLLSLFTRVIHKALVICQFSLGLKDVCPRQIPARSATMLMCWYLAGDVNNKCETHDPASHFVVDIKQK